MASHLIQMVENIAMLMTDINPDSATVSAMPFEVSPQKVVVLPDGRVSRSDAAKFLGYRSKTLAEWHRLGVGPRSRLVGGRRFYMIDELRRVASGEQPIRA